MQNMQRQQSNPLLEIGGLLKATTDKSEERLSWKLKSNSEFFPAKTNKKPLYYSYRNEFYLFNSMNNK
jgi:hypothetical protein